MQPSDSGPKIRVLVIEDDDRVREVICKMLVRGGCEPIEAANGLEGMRALEGGDIDVVLTDLIMPVQTGIETIRQIRRIHGDLPIIAVSGLWIDGATQVDDARAAGADFTMEKPFRGDTLLEAVESLACRRRWEGGG